MKYLLVALSSLVLFSGSAVAAEADSWAGPQLGVRVGWNHSELNDFRSAGAPMATVDFGWDIVIGNRVIFNPRLFYEWNQNKDRQHCQSGRECESANLGSRVYGLAILIGLPVGPNKNLMPYIRFDSSRLQVSGYAGGSGWISWGLGVGLEWRLSRSTGVVLQYAYAKYGGDVHDWRNSNFTVGVNFHF